MLAEWLCNEPPIDDLGRPKGVLAPDTDVRDTGRRGATMSVLDEGLAYDDTLARELGRLWLASDSGARFGRGPNDSRLIPDVLSRGTWLGLEDVEHRKLVGVVSSPARDEVDDPTARFRDRIVTVDGTPCAANLGDTRGGVCAGAGSFDRACCTLASRRCI